ncbi:MAG: hypothetical protein ACYTGV_20005 [Planctomycetota bacterium]|jgi:hypothetical protein
MNTFIQAELVYDSATSGSQSGTRGGLGAGRALLFRSGDIYVDLMAIPLRRERANVQGQVVAELDFQDSHALQNVPIVLGSTEVRTDIHGQFDITAEQTSRPQNLFLRTPTAEVVCTIPPGIGSGAAHA